MTAKFLLAALALATPVPASAPDALFVHISAVHQVDCTQGRGTAFEAGGHMISAAHVTSLRGCFIEGRAVTAHPEQGLDFSTIDLPAKGLKIDCGGFRENELYWAVGYSWGGPAQRVITLVGTGVHDGATGEAVLLGYPTVIPGMSGGPIINSRGEVVGTVNQYSPIYPLSMSRELRDTSVCQRA